MSKQPTTADLEWTDLDRRAVDTARVLAMDSVQKVGNGHPGTAMSLAPAAYLLFQKVMRHDPADADWTGRDRFVLSAGPHQPDPLHASSTWPGTAWSWRTSKAFRTWGSRTPGHPEYGHTTGVETTTGPLGQGVANAVGMAMAARYERGLFDPDAAPGTSPFDHTIWAIAGDGCLQEGISAEASSLAGHQKLGNLVLLWDDNHISIEGDTETAVSEDTVKRYEAYGWHVQRVEPLPDGDLDPHALYEALLAAKAETGRPSFIAMRSIIAWPAPNAQNTEAAHGSALGEDEVRGHQGGARLRPGAALRGGRRGARAHPRGRRPRPRGPGRRGRSPSPPGAPPTRSAPPTFDRIDAAELPEGWESHLPSFEAGKSLATRAASGKVLEALGAGRPRAVGRLGRPGGLQQHHDRQDLVVPAGRQPAAGRATRTAAPIHFGIREHSMAAEMNGITLHGNTRVYGGTFLVFSDYMRNAVRLSALMHLPVTYVWTHDSIGLGEDGPTHQPVEHLASLRAIPGPERGPPGRRQRDGRRLAGDLQALDEGVRQGRPARPGADPAGRADLRAQRGRGARRLRAVRGRGRPGAGDPDRHRLRGAARRRRPRGAAGRRASRPGWCRCRAWSGSSEQDQAYRDSVLPPSVGPGSRWRPASALTWHRFVGDAGRIVSLEHFGASADAKVLFREFGFTAEAVAAAARESLAAADR